MNFADEIKTRTQACRFETR